MNVISTAATNQSRGFYWPTSGFLINEEMKKRKKMMKFQRSRRSKSCDVVDQSTTRRHKYQSTGHQSFDSYFVKPHTRQCDDAVVISSVTSTTTSVTKETPSKKSSLGSMLMNIQNLVTRGGNTCLSKKDNLDSMPTRSGTGSKRYIRRNNRSLSATHGKWVTVIDG